MLPFYFGSIDDQSRLAVERELLTDSEILVDYFDLKRKIEAVQQVAPEPSRRLWYRLQAQLQPRKKLIYSLSLGFALTLGAIILATFVLKPTTDQSPLSDHKILFDSNSELSASSNVL